jgi:hypothetical protein
MEDSTSKAQQIIPVESNPSVAQQRLDTLAALVEVAHDNNLPALMEISFTSGGGLSLRMEENDRDGVHAWTAALGNGEVTEQRIAGSSGRPFTAVKSRLWNWQDPTWRGLYSVDIWSACRCAEAGEQA